ncbi:DUF4136 domain-containing protein [Ramlibacter sp. H39-3-26]|uniref:DUF4136 domain-containing protein n=1 Tax=Curvibacter soli TaxID=3031331 RepID=UPI0023DC26BC|nr:DUF4136 domain-containing protein [Ramlibacter sp. H39-3-26]MDF1484528.1 DUF4136 domain-containing protein [Ramlibacter sp. H39-3-26]
MTKRIITTTLACLAALALSGCGGMRLVDSDVQAFSALPTQPLPAATYRFERLPSQQTPQAAVQQRALEDIAEQALAKVGMQRDDAHARYTVQVGMQTTSRLRDDGWNDGWYGGPRWRMGVGLGFYGRRSSIGGMGWFPPTVLYQHEIGLVMRDTASNQIVYETHAVNDDLWNDDPAALAAMFDAALRDFPQPPQGPRRINIEIPR